MSCALDRFGSNSFPPVYWILRGMEKLNFEYFYNFNDIRDVGIIQLNIISKILLIYYSPIFMLRISKANINHETNYKG